MSDIRVFQDAMIFPQSNTSSWHHGRLRTTLARMILLGSLAALASCAMGRPFERSAAGTLVLGSTTIDDALSRLGPPQYRTTADKIPDGPPDLPGGFWPDPNERPNVEVLSWYQSSTDAKAVRKNLTLYFWRGRLVEHAFNSSDPADTTYFALGLTGRVQVGVTTRGEVESLLGAPSGEAIYPMTALPQQRILLYAHTAFDPSLNTLSRTSAAFLLDPSGVVRDVHIASSGLPQPAGPGPVYYYMPRGGGRGGKR